MRVPGSSKVVASLVFIFFAALLFASAGSSAAFAATPLAPGAVPEPLKPWTAWATDGKEDALCPTFHGKADVFRCAWPSQIDLKLDDHGGRFVQKWRIDVRTWVPLPGDDKRWPIDVKIENARAIVVSHNGAPSVELLPGERTVSGSFAWDSLPESIHVPPETALLSLSMRGAAIAAPNRDAQGTLWLQKAATKEEGDALEFVVHRKLSDDIPAMLVTRIELHVSGKNREELLGRALPPGFVPLSLDSGLPARLEPDGHVRTQVRPGIFVIEITARSEGPANTFKRPAPDGLWRVGEEVWVFEAKNDYRIVTVDGVSSLDPQQTTLPEAWKRLPAYPMKLTDALTLTEKRRGDADPPPNQLALSRSLWLDFDGTGYTVSDTLTGTLNRDSRLTMAPQTLLGRVSISGKDQFITHLGDASQTGVEVRQGHLTVNADSRIPGDPSDIPAVSWAHDFHQVSGTLHLPPGWRLLHASGVDDVPGTWVRHWSLLELFLALVLAVGFARVHGVRWGIASLVLFGLTFPEDGAPKWTWLVALALEAVFLVVPKGRVKDVFGHARTGAMVLVALIAIPFAIGQIRVGMYPTLSQPDAVVGNGEVDQDGSESLGFVRGDVSPAAPPPPQNGPVVPKVAPNTTPQSALGGQAATDAPSVERPADVSQQLEDTRRRELSKDEDKVGKSYKRPSGWSGSGSVSQSDVRFNSNAAVYDPTAIVQTGPGLPRWNWQTLSLSWSGPVSAAQRVHLYLLSPSMNLVLAFVRALLAFVLVLRFFPWTRRFFPGSWGEGPRAAAIAAALLVCIVMSPGLAHAQATPSKETLDELRDRLLRKPECTPSCAAAGRMAIEVRGSVLTLLMSIDAKASTAVPIPGSSAEWTPAEVLVDGKPAAGLLRLGDGTLWLELAEGSHQVTVRGPVPARESFQVALPLKPHHVEKAIMEGYSVEGLHEDGLADDNLQFTRVVAAAPGAPSGSLQPGALPPFVRVERTLQIGLNWQMDTHVVRVSPKGTAVVLEVPLLPGENVTTADVRVVAGKALVNMGPQAVDVTWHSVLEQKSPVVLTAGKSPSWGEVWRVDVGPVWHASYAGIPMVHTEPESDIRTPTFRPWPGETEKIELTRPNGVTGQTLTIDGATMDVRPGLRATDVTLTLSVRSSRGAEHSISLPDGAELESLSINGATQPIRQQGRNVTVPVTPGAESVVLTWREPRGISTMFGASSVDLGAPSVNATTTMQVSGERWLLFAFGPRVGPAVLFWSLLLVLFAVSLALGRNRWTPLRFGHWLLLGVGLSQVHVALAAVFVAWLLALGWRARNEGTELGHVAFNFRQLALIALTFTALGILGVSIYQGLLGAPDMQVRGNGSGSSTLRWFADRSTGVLPSPWMISVPLLFYRGAMLVWSLFIALALVRWLRWGWGAFSKGTAWKKAPPWVAPPPQQPAPYRYPVQPMQPPAHVAPMQGPPMQGPPMQGPPLEPPPAAPDPIPSPPEPPKGDPKI